MSSASNRIISWNVADLNSTGPTLTSPTPPIKLRLLNTHPNTRTRSTLLQLVRRRCIVEISLGHNFLRRSKTRSKRLEESSKLELQTAGTNIRMELQMHWLLEGWISCSAMPSRTGKDKLFPTLQAVSLMISCKLLAIFRRLPVVLIRRLSCGLVRLVCNGFSHYVFIVNRELVLTSIVTTGWPTAGSTYQSAVPGVSSAQTYWQTAICGILDWGVNVFSFEAFDEPWKPVSTGADGSVADETHWGVWNADRSTKYSTTC